MKDIYPTPGIYQHYKGGYYTVLGVGKHTESGQLLVTYIDADGELWNRPLAMWFDAEEWEGKLVPRFTKIRKPERKSS
jgi:hypothetical protein